MHQLLSAIGWWND